jgi:hypothetical protein
VILSSLFDGYQHFGGTCCLGLQDNLQLFYILFFPLLCLVHSSLWFYLFYYLYFSFSFFPLLCHLNQSVPVLCLFPHSFCPWKMVLWRVTLSYSVCPNFPLLPLGLLTVSPGHCVLERLCFLLLVSVYSGSWSYFSLYLFHFFPCLAFSFSFPGDGDSSSAYQTT